MSRAATAAEKTALAKQQLDIFWAVKVENISGVSRLWSGLGDKQIGGETYIGTGALMDIGEIQETSDLSATNVTLVFSGIPTDLISLALNADYRNGRCRILFGFEEHVRTIFIGLVDSMQITEGRDTSRVTINVESAMALFNRDSTLRMTNANHQDRHPGDRFFEFVESLSNKPVAWGAEGNATLR